MLHDSVVNQAREIRAVPLPQSLDCICESRDGLVFASVKLDTNLGRTAERQIRRELFHIDIDMDIDI